ncbi:MAG: 6,7-dimethyl-8-ribityllumazine synthase [Sphingobacteriales bacterium]|nr:6,7-dimethyl-8-ribityllumazine synthase [Sphingobacteriales bacterium]MCC7223666.1 6,7-dimethyl-8-ribityllumazine synthase [Chitinophagales bacterium]
MATELHHLDQHDSDLVPDAADMRFGIVVADYNPAITHALLDGCYQTLTQYGVKPEHICVWHTPGAFELPLSAQLLHRATRPDAVICLGCVIKGDTDHDKYINAAVSQAIMRLGLKYRKPFVFGVLTPNTLAQAQDRAGGKHGNKGTEAAVAAIQMVALCQHAAQLRHQRHEKSLAAIDQQLRQAAQEVAEQ